MNPYCELTENICDKLCPHCENLNEKNANSKYKIKTQRGDFKWKDETQQEVVFVPNDNGKLLIAMPNEKDSDV